MTDHRKEPRDRVPTGPLGEWCRACPVRKTRMANGLTQRALAAASGVSEITVRTVEQGASRNPVRALAKLARALGDPTIPARYERWMRHRPRAVPKVDDPPPPAAA